jgi:hypothetical protein
MPLVYINTPTATPDRLTALGNAVHQALIDAFAIPVDDHFQIRQGSSADQISYDPDYLGVHRDDGIAFVHVFLRSGRSDAQKQAFYRALANHAARVGIEARNLFVILTENTLADWSFGNGIAQYLDTPITAAAPDRKPPTGISDQ